MTVPALICPAYNRHDLLERMLESVDVPIERGLIVDNGFNYDPSRLSREALEHVFHVKHWRPPFASIGYGGAINFGITQMADAPWWLWASNDVQFLPGHLATVVERMEAARGKPTIITGGFTWAALNPELVYEVGLIDDWSFFPIYFDDNDYHWRVVLAGATWIEDGHTGIVHGEGDGGSLTIRSDPVVRERNHHSFRENEQRYRAKWGGMPGQEVYRTPWNLDRPLWATGRPEITGRARRQW